MSVADNHPDNQQEQLQRQAAQIDSLQAKLSAALLDLNWAQLKIQSLEEKLRQERIARFGPRSENLTNLQLLLLDEEPSVTLDEVSGEAGREALAEPTTEVAAPAPSGWSPQATSGTAGVAGTLAAQGRSDRLPGGSLPVPSLR